MFELFFKGCLIGFSIAMPVGPIGLLCIRHALVSGGYYGLIVGLGAACADSLYGALAGFGVTAVAQLLTNYYPWMQWIGGLFLCYLGITTFLAKKVEASEAGIRVGAVRLFLTTFCLTLTNPMTILSFAGIYAALGIGGGEIVHALTMTTGVFAGSALWWLFLSTGAALFKEKMEGKSSWLNKVSGVMIFGFGVATLA